MSRIGVRVTKRVIMQKRSTKDNLEEITNCSHISKEKRHQLTWWLLEYLFKCHQWEMPDQISWGKWSDIIVRQLLKVFMRRTLQDGRASTCSLNKKDVLVTHNEGYTKNVTFHDITNITRFWMRKTDQKLCHILSYPPYLSLEKISSFFIVSKIFQLTMNILKG